MTAAPAMDFEKFSGLSREQINSIGLAFLQELERLTGVKPMLYTDAYAAMRSGRRVWGTIRFGWQSTDPNRRR